MVSSGFSLRGLSTAHLHTFDINKSASVISTWRSFEERTRTHAETCLQPLSPESRTSEADNVKYDICYNPLPAEESENVRSSRVGRNDPQNSGLRSTASPLVASHIENLESCKEAALSSENENGLTQREPRSEESPILEPSGSLLSVFELELAKLMNQNTESEVGQESPLSAQSTEDHTSTPEPEQNAQFIPRTAETIGQTMNNLLLGSVELLTSELRTRLAQVEQGLADVQLESTVQETLATMKTQLVNLTQTIHDATASLHATVAQSPHAEMIAASQIQKFRRLTSEIGEMGRAFISTLENNFSGGINSANEPNPQSSESAPSRGQSHVSPQPEIDHILTPPSGESPVNAETPEEGTPDEDSSSTQTLFIGNLTPASTEDMILQTLLSCGFFGTVNLPRDSTSGKHAGFGYIRFPSRYAASGALRGLTNGMIDGQRINVEYSQDCPTETDHAESSACFSSLNSVISTSLVSPSTRKLRKSHSRKLRPSVTFDVSADKPNTTQIRRAKSLDAIDGNLDKRHTESQIGYEGLGESSSHHLIPNDCNSELHRSDPSVTNPSLSSFSPNPQTDDYSSPSCIRDPWYKSMSRSSTTDGYQRFGESSARPSSTHSTENPLSPMVSNRESVVQNPELSPELEREPSGPPISSELPGAWPRKQSENRGRGHRDRPIMSLPPMTTSSAVPPSRPLTFSSSSYPVPNPSAYYTNSTVPTNQFLLTDPLPGTPGSFPSESLANDNSGLPIDAGADGAHHQDQSRQDVEQRINACVDSLIALGFTTDNRDASRLRIYAEAAEGQLCDAIDMIEEERGAYEQRSAQS